VLSLFREGVMAEKVRKDALIDQLVEEIEARAAAVREEKDHD
jgi:hypothetical protein